MTCLENRHPEAQTAAGSNIKTFPSRKALAGSTPSAGEVAHVAGGSHRGMRKQARLVYINCHRVQGLRWNVDDGGQGERHGWLGVLRVVATVTSRQPLNCPYILATSHIYESLKH